MKPNTIVLSITQLDQMAMDYGCT